MPTCVLRMYSTCVGLLATRFSASPLNVTITVPRIRGRDRGNDGEIGLNGVTTWTRTIETSDPAPVVHVLCGDFCSKYWVVEKLDLCERPLALSDYNA